jgi:hypothetical protein
MEVFLHRRTSAKVSAGQGLSGNLPDNANEYDNSQSQFHPLCSIATAKG